MPARPILARWLPTLLLPLALVSASPGAEGERAPNGAMLFEQAAALAAGLDADSAADRAVAERKLAELAPTGAEAERLLALWPQLAAGAPPAVREGLERVRSVLEQRVSLGAIGPSRVTLRARGMPLAEALAALKSQTGNDVALADGAEGLTTRVTATFDGAPFWAAIDELLDSARLSIDPYAGAALRVSPRPEGQSPRGDAVAYAGPLRIEPLRLRAARGVRAADERALDVVLEVAWEPRLRPIAVAHSMSDLSVTTEGGRAVRPRQPRQRIDVEAPPESASVEVTLGLELPDRSTKRLDKITGVFDVLAPTRRSVFRFDGAGRSKAPRSEVRSGSTVTLEGFAERGDLWELRMKLTLDNPGDALASHRGWVFDNPSHLEDAAGKRFEHAGFETVVQNESTVGLVYYFEFGKRGEWSKGFDPRELVWVYQTPVGVVRSRLAYELGPLDLP
jgi:hypothetical protein